MKATDARDLVKMHREAKKRADAWITKWMGPLVVWSALRGVKRSARRGGFVHHYSLDIEISNESLEKYVADKLRERGFSVIVSQSYTMGEVYFTISWLGRNE